MWPICRSVQKYDNRIENTVCSGLDVFTPMMIDGFDGVPASMESVMDLPVAPIRIRSPFSLDLHGYFLYFSSKVKRVLKK
ncbi:MAG: hypothetical protein PVF26_08065 [Desulfobacterales bacterium]|jgi:hypothetical protein